MIRSRRQIHRCLDYKHSKVADMVVPPSFVKILERQLRATAPLQGEEVGTLVKVDLGEAKSLAKNVWATERQPKTLLL